MEQQKSFYINRYGIRVKKCCASCMYKTVDKAGRKMCKKNKQTPSLCDDWRVHEKLESAGKGTGRIKKNAYLRSVLDKQGRPFIYTRKDFEREYGSIYERDFG